MLRKIGVAANKIKKFGSLKLLGTLLQLCQVSVATGLDIASQREEVVERWDKDLRLEALRPLFALYDLRLAASHKLGEQEAEMVRSALEVYGIEEDDMKTGWGLAVDKVYDRLTQSLNELSVKLRLEGLVG